MSDKRETDKLRQPVPQPWGDVYSPEELAQAQLAGLQLLRALQVIILTPHIELYLEQHDPQALRQARQAVEAAGGRSSNLVAP